MEIRKCQREPYEIIQQNFGESSENKKIHLVKFVLDSFINENLFENSKSAIHCHVSDFCYKLFKRLDKCRRSYDTLIKNNSSWLNKDVVFPLLNVLDPDATSTYGPRGRPNQNFEDCSVRSKK